MSNLDKVKSIWLNLEDNYNRYLSSNRKIEKLDFIKFLIGYKEGESKIASIINKISDDESMKDESYSQMVNTLRCIDGVIKRDEIEAIADFDSFISYCIENDVNEVKSLPQEVLDSINVLTSPLVEKCSITEVISTTGVFDEVYKFENSSKSCIHLVPENSCNGCYCVKGNNDLNEIINDYSLNKSSKFLSSLVKFLQELMSSKSLKPGMVFLNEDYYTVGNKVITILGDSSNTEYPIRKNNITEINGYTFYKLNFSSNGIKTILYCFSGKKNVF